MKLLPDKVSIGQLFGIISSMLGYTFGAMTVLLIISELTDGVPSEYPFFIDFAAYLVMFAIWGCFISIGKRMKKKTKRLHQYEDLIYYNNVRSLEEIAASTNQSINFVKHDLQTMINKKYFKNMVIDMELGEIVIGNIPQMQGTAISYGAVATDPVETLTIKCQSCGAVNSKESNTPSVCEYCGSPI